MDPDNKSAGISTCKKFLVQRSAVKVEENQHPSAFVADLYFTCRADNILALHLL